MAINPEVLIMICSPEQCASHWGCKGCRLLLLPGGVFVALLELEPTLPQPPPFCPTSIHGQWQESSFTCLMPLQSQTCHFALGLAILYKEDLQNWRMRGICPNATPPSFPDPKDLPWALQLFLFIVTSDFFLFQLKRAREHQQTLALSMGTQVSYCSVQCLYWSSCFSRSFSILYSLWSPKGIVNLSSGRKQSPFPSPIVLQDFIM